MKRCQTCGQLVRSVKPPTVNYTMFSSRCAGIDMAWVLPCGGRWKDKPYMEKYKMYPHQVEVTGR